MIRKVSFFYLAYNILNYKKEKKNTYSTKEVKGIKINLDFIFNNFPVHRTGLRLVIYKGQGLATNQFVASLLQLTMW